MLPEPSFDRIAATRDPLVPPERLNPRLSPHVAAAITKALHLAATERHQDIASFQQTLVGHVPVVPVPPAPPARARVAVPTLPAWVPEMVLVPAGDFLMGSTDADAKFDEEKPQHRVTLPAYEIGKTEVTNAQFRRVVAGDGYTNRAYWDDAGWQWRTDAKRKQPTYWNDAQGNGDNQPVVGVTLYEAVAYTRWLSVQTGQNFRLPTEAEWEKAARGTDGRIYPWGNTWDEKLANSSESVLGKTTPVGQYPNGASPYGALDMAGNVWEWTWSETQAYPLAQPAGERLYTIKADRAYTLRGGSWAHGRVYARCAVRYDHYAHFVGGYDGFRIVCLFSSQTQSVPSPQAQPALQVQPTPARVAVPTLPAWVPEMVLVPTGDFLMGSTDAAAKFDEEKPQHILTLPAYEIGKTQVTNAQFRRFVAGDGYTNRTYWDDAGWQWRTQNQCVQPAYWNDAQWNGDNQPVVGVTLYEAVAYTRWLRAQTGQNFRLPTEAEWEKAARGSDGRIYPWGNTWDAKRANSSESNLGKTTPVGQYPNGASPYGALDMAGNVWEWTLSEKQAYPLAQPAGESLYTIKVDRIYVLRGGSWFSKRVSARCAYRYVVTSPRAGNNYFGFRLARHL